MAALTAPGDSALSAHTGHSGLDVAVPLTELFS